MSDEDTMSLAQAIHQGHGGVAMKELNVAKNNLTDMSQDAL